MEFLNKILARQAEVVQQLKQTTPQELLQSRVDDMPATLGFAKALRAHSSISASTPAIISEMKKKSPSAGVLREEYSAPDLAKSYVANGASCISVLTNEHFAGEDEHIIQVREAVSVPLLRKDFIIDAYQVYETRALGADALLLIVAALTDEDLSELGALGLGLGLDVLFESHSADEAQRSLAIAQQVTKQNAESSAQVMLGVNSRDLHSFDIDLKRAMDIITHLKGECDYLLVAESGIKSAEDIQSFTDAGADAFLIGERFMRAADPGAELKKFIT